MSDETEIERGDAMIAAEYALGLLLEGEELLMARGRMATDADFAADVTQWEKRLAPLLDEVAPMVPSAEVWARIEDRVEAQRAAQAEAELSGGGGAAANVVMLEHRVRRWQWTAALTSTAAAVLFGFIAITGNRTPVIVPVNNPPEQIAEADPLVAQVPIGETGLRLDVTYIPESERMLVGAIGLTADGVHDHELWLVPADGSALQSLGVVAPGEVRSMELPENVTRNMGEGVQLVLTREPIGGKPEGVDAGPVVAEGAFSQV
ncbi:anti-sigma factor [Erythrobacter ani]|uniref:Anti-sigma factor n=1 Tax=Erythrobacter ani TaxID=2827235 RepID=A0ABS6SIZ5_9SPHN|nr:anti-sigma factor [Erythrobacter ani]MBV7264973.1 anti-sigma factor [Erythrobacter ani]